MGQPQSGNFPEGNEENEITRRRFRLPPRRFLGSCVTTEIRAQVVVVPNAQATSDGNTSGTSPSGPTAPVRWLIIYDAAQFGTLSGPSFLSQFAYRPDTTHGPSGPRTPTLRVYASTTSRSVAGMSTTFAENVGTNNTLVFSGPLTWTTANLPGPGNTRQFDVVFPLTTPFLYDPAAGNLVLDLQLTSPDGESIRFDAVSGNPTMRGIIGFGSATASTGSFTDSQVTQFTFEPPPLVTIRASQVEVCWNSISNLTYQVQSRSDLTTNLWTPLGDDIRSTGATSCDDPIVVGRPQKFYRVVLLP